MGDLQSRDRNATSTLKKDKPVSIACIRLVHRLLPVDCHPRCDGGDWETSSLLVRQVIRRRDESVGVKPTILGENAGKRQTKSRSHSLGIDSTSEMLLVENAYHSSTGRESIVSRDNGTAHV